jgi:hypothetical protein
MEQSGEVMARRVGRVLGQQHGQACAPSVALGVAGMIGQHLRERTHALTRCDSRMTDEVPREGVEVGARVAGGFHASRTRRHLYGDEREHRPAARAEQEA